MTQQRQTPNESVDRWGVLFKPHLVSLLFHVGLIGVIVGMTTLSVRDRAEVIEVEIMKSFELGYPFLWKGRKSSACRRQA